MSTKLMTDIYNLILIFKMARLTGFEPVAYGLEVRCSIRAELQAHGAGNETRTRDPQLGRLML